MIKIFPVNQVALIDKYTIENEPILSFDLMERAATQIFEALQLRYPKKRVSVFAGPGNNGGDALALARMLMNDGVDVTVYVANPSGRFSDDAKVNYDRLLNVAPKNRVVTLSDDVSMFPELTEEDLLIDGLFGSGLNRPLEGLYLKIVKLINRTEAKVVSIDIPSGLFGENNNHNNIEGIVKADETYSFEFPKLSFLLADYGSCAGKWDMVNIGIHPKAIEEFQTDWFLTDFPTYDYVKARDRFSHKGDFGHALLIAGSYGKMGAAVLASRGCLKTGVGLLTTHVPRYGCQIIQTAVPAAMASIDRSDILISEFPDLDMYSAVGVGPGIGKKSNTVKAIKSLLESVGDKPLVMDADALNILSENRELLNLLPENCILTPHPKEFDRLAGERESHYDRLLKLMSFVKKYKVLVVLKGAYTITALPDGKCFFNTSGNPGMATAGSGDVLTGMILALLAQGYSLKEAAITGVYAHGMAGDRAADNDSEVGLTASGIIENIGPGFKI